MSYTLRLLTPGETPQSLDSDEHMVACSQCERELVMSGDSGSLPDGPDVTPDGMGDDDWEEDDHGESVWTCKLCRRTATAGEDEDDE